MNDAFGEGLLNLREGDRLELVLRILEERSLREVGAALGVDEDAARKRVSRALDRLAADSEEHQAQSAIDRFLSDYHAAQAQEMRRVEPTENELNGHEPEETRVFKVPDVSEELREIPSDFVR